MDTDGIFTDAELTPEEVLKVLRSVVTELDIRKLMRVIIDNAIENGSPQAWAWIEKVILPKDREQVEDKRWKRVVFCTFEQYNEVETLKREVARLEKKVKELESSPMQKETE